MNAAFYVAAAVAVAATALTVTGRNAVHALLYLVVSLFSVAIVFFALGAPFIAALEAIVYAGAIMVLFMFVIMMLNLGPEAADQERLWLRPRIWAGPAILCGVLLGTFFSLLTSQPGRLPGVATAGPRQVGLALFGPYLLGLELTSMLLLAGLVGAYHLGRPGQPGPGGGEEEEAPEEAPEEAQAEAEAEAEAEKKAEDDGHRTD